MSTTSSKERIRQTWAAAHAGDLAVLSSLVNSPDDKATAINNLTASGIAERAAFPNPTATINEVIEAGDQDAVFWHRTGRHEQSLFDVTASHRTVNLSSAALARFIRDLTAEEYLMWESHALLTELGIIPMGGDR